MAVIYADRQQRDLRAVLATFDPCSDEAWEPGYSGEWAGMDVPAWNAVTANAVEAHRHASGYAAVGIFGSDAVEWWTLGVGAAEAAAWVAAGWSDLDAVVDAREAGLTPVTAGEPWTYL